MLPPRPRLLFVAHVDWGHIWQRPHHLATELVRFAEVLVVHPLSRNRSRLVAHSARSAVRRAPLVRLPGSYRSASVLDLNNRICALQAAGIVRRFRPHALLVTAPECYAWVRDSVGNARLAYDCMDDALAFAQDEEVRERKAALERELLGRAHLVTCSSDELVARCAERGAARARTVHNGWDPVHFPVRESRPLPRSGALTLGYFGTIGPWLDTESLETLAAACEDVRVRLVGPNEIGYAPDSDRISVEPPLPHGQLAHAVADCDAMLLPFRVDELTNAVDPVKLYEYVALGRPIAARRWPELGRFERFATFYDDASELVERVGGRRIAGPPSATERSAFLESRSWAHRAESLAGQLFPDAGSGSSGAAAASISAPA